MEVSWEMSSPLLNLLSISNTVLSMLSMSDFTLQAAKRQISTKANQLLDLYSKFSIVSTIHQFNNSTTQQFNNYCPAASPPFLASLSSSMLPKRNVKPAHTQDELYLDVSETVTVGLSM